MRIIEILNEKRVDSAWISNITYSRPDRVITMKLSNGKIYSIFGISRTIFERWFRSNSKGQFFHRYIKNVYQIKRIE